MVASYLLILIAITKHSFPKTERTVSMTAPGSTNYKLQMEKLQSSMKHALNVGQKRSWTNLESMTGKRPLEEMEAFEIHCFFTVAQNRLPSRHKTMLNLQSKL